MRILQCAVVCLSVSAFAQATVVTKEGTGEAAISGNDEARAFDEAKERALRSAVEQAAGVRIDADSLAVNNQLVRDQVFANTGGYVKKFEIISKEKKKNVAVVTVKADVVTDNLDKDIEAARTLVKRMGRPSIVIVVQEQTVPAGEKVITNSETLATVLTEAFKADGWDIKDAQALNKTLALEGAATLGATEIKRIQDLTKTQYILYGKAVLRHQQVDNMLKDSKIFPVTGEYDLALAATDNDSQITKVAGKLGWNMKENGAPVISYERTALDMIKMRKDEIIAPVRKAILEHFRDQQVNGMEIALAVAGLESFGAAQAFQKSLEAIKGVKEAGPGAKPYEKGKATYKVHYLGSTSDLAALVEASTFKKRKIEVTSVSGNTLELSVGK
ncbi:MAG: flagellar assembly protein T N-terminal domain-containing protein [Archangium sp.]|nr:flagellar assembly protein T N-terminal domain-containing protein [Archangium sp.]